jgi:hypothetical protein
MNPPTPCVNCVPIRRLPVGPPSSVQFGATVNILGVDHPDVVRLVQSGAFKSITAHGELELPKSCFLAVHPSNTMLTTARLRAREPRGPVWLRESRRA